MVCRALPGSLSVFCTHHQHHRVTRMTESYDDFISNYLRRINDLDNPLPEDSEIFLPERRVQPGPQHYERREVRLPSCLSREEGERLRAEYWQSVETPATNTLHTFPPDTLTQVLEGKGWIVPRLLRSAGITELL